jgi:hypothetical protein
MDTIFVARLSFQILVGAAIAAVLSGAKAQGPEPGEIAAPDLAVVAKVHAEGAQIYECKMDARGERTWQFREPIATLLVDGKTIGRHFAGPRWELMDGSAVGAEVAGKSPGATPNDIPLLKLKVTAQARTGRLAEVTVIQRLNTSGGVLEGTCASPGELRSMPYAADYTFLQPAH